MTGDGWIMVGIMVFVLIAQTALWMWVLIEKRNKAPDVEIINLRELLESSRRSIDEYYSQMGLKKRP